MTKLPGVGRGTVGGLDVKLPRVRPTDAPAPGPLLEVVGHLHVPPSVLHHRFYLEALANAQLAAQRDEDESRVVGTANTRAAELYGWGENVLRHIDNTGFVYLTPLAVDSSFLYASHQGELIEQRLRPGEVVRLWDWAAHWTEDRGPVVAAFVGAFPAPCDGVAMQLLDAAIGNLAVGGYYSAPRVAGGYRVLLPDECWATRDFAGADPQIIRRADARGLRMHVIPCSQCNGPAVSVDKLFPYHWEHNLCREHLRALRGGHAEHTEHLQEAEAA